MNSFCSNLSIGILSSILVSYKMWMSSKFGIWALIIVNDIDHTYMINWLLLLLSL